MKTKIIPFDLEIANKIQAGEIEGNIIVKATGNNARIICTDLKGHGYPIIFLENKDGLEVGAICSTRGFLGQNEILALKVPNNEPQFKPFDRVLMRNVNTNWYPTIFSNKELTGFRNIGGELCAYCIPYEGNEHLVGTTDNPE